MKKFLFVGILLSALVFTGCGKNKEEQIQDFANAEIKVETETEMPNAEEELISEEIKAENEKTEQ